MSVLVLINPSSMAAKELLEKIGERPTLAHELRLLTTLPEEVGRLTESAGTPSLVQAFEAEALENAGVVFLCGPRNSLSPALEALPPAATAVVLAPDAAADDGTAVVAGVNIEKALRGDVVVSPHPAVVATAHLIRPLQSFGPRKATATLVQPASVAGQEGLDELFEQTRRVLAFASDRPEEIFGRQLAFNLFPVPDAPTSLGPQTREILGGEVDISLHLLQGGIFHGLSVSLFIHLDAAPDELEVREALSASPFLELVEDQDLLGPVDAAGRDEMLVGDVRRLPGNGGMYHVWAVMDNLTLGSALNALRIAEAVL